ncbi:site-specific integrase [Pseudomonas sp. UMAB-08]|uniref:tyrosine-type recombinase/integrase n=1 Tax=Pseudomonas sp. UMAB-08 TaxID=1365375 RepID=UPI00214B78C1|nr:site-specific integrase [Pseudomonas sp. UMAB-08]
MKLHPPEKALSLPPPITLIPTERNGRQSYRLISSDQLQDDFFDSWSHQLSRKRSKRTTKIYSEYNKVFLELLQQITYQEKGLTPILLAQTIDSYESFLVFGTDSDIPMIQKAAYVLGDRHLSGSSVGVALAALNHFIDASERLRLGLIELEIQGYIASKSLSGFSLAQTVSIESPKNVRAAIKANSWLAGCLAGGARRIKRKGLSAISKPSSLAHTDMYGGDDFAFPIDKCMELIQSTTCRRDRMLWSLLAACGARVSEALTMLWKDIKPEVESEFNRVLIVDPATRRNVLIKYLSESEINSLPHKGRAHPETFLIEPFASMFWIALEEYNTGLRKQHYLAPVTHDFLVRNLKNGDPMHNSYQALYERFRKAALRVTGKAYGFHSLRHMYGYYLTNHCPNPNPHSNRRYGLDLDTVQKLMGHKLSKTTKRYARQDAHLLQATLAAANLARLTGGPKSVLEARIAFHQQEIKQLQQLALEAA